MKFKVRDYAGQVTEIKECPNKWSVAKSFMYKTEKEALNFQRPFYFARLRKIVMGKPQKMSFSEALGYLVKKRDLSIFPDAPEPAENQNSNQEFVENCFDIFGPVRTAKALIEEDEWIKKVIG